MEVINPARPAPRFAMRRPGFRSPHRPPDLYALSVSWCPGVFVVSAAKQRTLDQTFYPGTDFELPNWMTENADCERLGPGLPFRLVSSRSEFPRAHSFRARSVRPPCRFTPLTSDTFPESSISRRKITVPCPITFTGYTGSTTCRGNATSLGPCDFRRAFGS